MMTTNSYGFDFLKTEHKLDEDGQPVYQEAVKQAAPIFFENSEVFADARNKPDLEKQFDILAFLQKHRGSGSCLAPNIIYRATGIDLETDITVANLLQSNPKIKTENIPDPENPALLVPHYAYQAKYPNVRDRTTLLAQINRMHTGVPARDLVDSYDGIEADMKALVTAGDVIAIHNTEDKDKILFPRGESFFVELDGLLSLPDRSGALASTTAAIDESSFTDENKTQDSPIMNSNSMEVDGGDNNKKFPKQKQHDADNGKVFVMDADVDPRTQIRRGEAIQVGGQWFRVSSAVRSGASLAEQPARAQAPLSVVSLLELSQRNEVDGYIRPLTAKKLPLDDALSEAAQANLLAARHARERLLKLAHGGRSGVGVAGQLTGSHAHASNPTTLAASFATTAVPNHSRNNKRPHTMTTSTKNDGNGELTNNHHHHYPQPAELSKATLEKAAADPALALYSHARRHGCTKDVREMYLATRSVVPESDYDLQHVLVEHKLLEPKEEMRRARLSVKGNNVDNDGKPKKRRYYERKNQRMTNTFLEGTEIGAILARAAEMQKQGKSVGDGGM